MKTRPTQMRLGKRDLAIIDSIVDHAKFSSRTSAVRIATELYFWQLHSDMTEDAKKKYQKKISGGT